MIFEAIREDDTENHCLYHPTLALFPAKQTIDQI
jgi:hypothetical protein